MVVGRLDRFSTSIPTFDLSEIGGWESGVSRNHAQLRREGNKLYLVDLKSSNGTFLNGQRLVPGKEQLLHDGDTIRLGLLDIKAVFDKDLELTEDER